MAIPQSIPSPIFPRVLSPQQFIDLLEILRELDLELNFARGVPDGQMLKVKFPISCARAFLRAHEALERARPVPRRPLLRRLMPAGRGNPDLVFEHHDRALELD